MATGDQQDMFSRLKSLLPPWFNDNNPVLDALLWGAAQALAWSFSLYLFAKLQTRIKTGTGGWLDMISLDFFGSSLPRGTGASDASYRNRILINLVRERGTRYAITKVLTDLTGRAPLIFEPSRPADTGAYGVGQSLGYGMAGGYGSLVMPYQALVTAFRPLNQGFPNIAGYGSSTGGYSQGSQADYASMSQISAVTDADIVAAVEAVRPISTTVWMRISS
ncbi:hypothetical protein ACUXVY_12960 [Chromobacterium haemolyticum]|uniref:hypothetical protein n=1 Tax=Chromobacterium haemolyticum TaxID=394935 RepID=UPI004055CF9D